jgi:hypothetical protein
MMYEMLTGAPIADSIKAEINIPEYLSDNARSVLQAFLT